VDRRDISFLRFIFEAYEGIAVVRTVNPAIGHVVLHVPPGCEDEVDMVLHDISKDMMITPVTAEGKETSGPL
jgi:hypothetical protein